MKKKSVAILLTTYNGERYIRQQFDSILAQTFDNWHLYISDDCSTDTTNKIIEEYCGLYPDRFTNMQNRIRFGNARDHFLCLLSNVDAEYYMFSDQDDVWLPWKVEETIALLRSLEKKYALQPIMVHTDLEVVDKDLHTISNSFIKASKLNPQACNFYSQLIQNCVTGCTMAFNAELRKLVTDIHINLGEESPILMHDWWIGIVAYCFGIVSFLDKPTVKYRQHDTNAIGAVDLHNVSYLIKRIFGGKMKKALYAAMEQAAYFSKVYSSCLPDHLMVKTIEFGSIMNKGKLHRIHFFLKSGIMKQGGLRKIAQLLVG